MNPKRLSILGVGLLGGSLGLAVRAMATDCKIIGYGHRRETLDQALACGAVDEAYEDACLAVRDSDLVVLCTPVGLLEPLIERIAPALADGAIVTDVGSTKRTVVKAAERLMPPTAHFVGSHPMAGSEKRGVRYAKADLFQGAACIVTPTHRTQPTAARNVVEFWRSLGMRVTIMSPDKHDQTVADISHLPHAVAASLVRLQDEASLPVAGKGFLDSTRIAQGDGGLWRDILIDNRDNLQAGVRRLHRELTDLLALLESRDEDAVQTWLNQAAERRKSLAAPSPEPNR